MFDIAGECWSGVIQVLLVIIIAKDREIIYINDSSHIRNSDNKHKEFPQNKRLIHRSNCKC